MAGNGPEPKQAGFRALFHKLRKRRIVETMAAFIGGGWLLVEVVERLLVSHYKFPEEAIDLTVISVIGALLATLVWRWFGSTEKRPGNIKVEVLLAPLIVLAALAVDLTILLKMMEMRPRSFLIIAVALCLGIAWIILKSLQWAAAAPNAAKEKDQSPAGLPTSPPPFEKSIVVLPFADMSPQKDQEYFCDGMSEEIITDLSHVHDLLVISRSSAMTFKGTQKKTGEIAKEVNVRYVLEGSVRKAGNDLRITAQLIDARNDAHLWAEKFGGTLDDVFDIQEKVSRSIVDALKLKLSAQEQEILVARPIANVAAYDLHMRARREMWLGTEEGLDRALRLVQQATVIVGDNEILYADMSDIYIFYMDAGIKKEEELFLKAEEYIHKIFALNPKSSRGHYLRGMIHRKKGDILGAVREFKQSLALDPNAPESLMWLGWVYSHSGRPLAARPLIRKLLAIDPLTPFNHFFSAGQSFMEGQFIPALQELQVARRMDEVNPIFIYWYAKGLAYAQRLPESLELFDRIEREFPLTTWAQLSSFFGKALQKRKAEALQSVTEEFKSLMRSDEIYPIWMAESYALIDEKSEAVDWIESGITAGFINYPFLMEHDPFLLNLHGEPGFKKLMARVKVEWEHFEE